MRKHYSSAFKAQVIQEVFREEKTLAQVASQFGVHVNMVRQWKTTALSGLPSLFDRETNIREERDAQDRKTQELYAQIGRLTTQVEWLKKKSGLEPD